MSEPPFAYDQVEYTSNPYPQTHPDHIGTIGRIFGMSPAPLTGARVLEIGCSSGGNLIPMALAYPGSRFVGVDLAASAIGQAQAAVAALGATNIEFVHADLAMVDASWGTFDYILAHGVYSWVPDTVRGQIFELFARNLAPQGIAYVSYNALPGWRLRGVCREMMLFHSGAISDPIERSGQGRALIEFLAKNVPEGNEWSTLLRGEVDRMNTVTDAYLFHDNLAEFMEPSWFHQVVARAATHGLQYLGESAFNTMILANFGPEIVSVLSKVGDLVRTEQYMDFIRNRAFRMTLFCREGIPLERKLEWEVLLPFRITTRARPVDPDPPDAKEQKFRTNDGQEVTATDPLVKAMLQVLADQRPHAYTFDELLVAARERAGGDPRPDDRKVLGENLLSCFVNGIIQPRWILPEYAETIADRPKAWDWARYQAARGLHYVTNPRNEGVEVDPLDRVVLRMLDGTHSRAEITDAIMAAIGTGEIEVRKKDGPFTDEAELRIEVERSLDLSVAAFLRSAVLAP